MKRNKIVEIILSLMIKVKIKDKRIRYAVLGILGLALAASTQLTNIDGEIGSVSPSKEVIEQVVEDEVSKAAGDVIEEVLKNLF
jgi:hypothetical protein